MAPGITRVLGLPAVLWFATALLLGILQTVVDDAWAGTLFDVVQYRVYPVVFALCAVLLAASFHTRRHRGALTRRARSDHRFVAALLTIMCLTGVSTGFWVPLVVGGVCVLAMLVPTRARAER